METLTLVLTVVCVFGLIAESTRALGVICLALLIALHPKVFIALLIIAVIASISNHRRKDK